MRENSAFLKRRSRIASTPSASRRTSQQLRRVLGDDAARFLLKSNQRFAVARCMLTAVSPRDSACAQAPPRVQPSYFVVMIREGGRVQSDRLRLQQMQTQLGVPPASPAPHPDAEETMCVVCFDAPKDHLVLPCKHLCVCEACAEQLTKTRTPMCPVCRGPIRETTKVFCS